MNLHSLQTFIAIVETGSLVRASEQLNVTQSTVTARLRSLEDSLGQQLIKRQKSGAVLTAPGIRFKRYAEVMLHLWRQARQETSLPEGIDAMCNFACHNDLWATRGEPMVRCMHRQQASMALTIWQGSASEIERWLADGLIDIAVSHEATLHDQHHSLALAPEVLMLVSTRPDSPMRFDPGYIYVDAGEDFGHRHAEAYADADTARVTFNNANWALQHLTSVGGSAYLPANLCAPLLQSGRLYAVAQAPQFERPVFLNCSDKITADLPELAPMLAALAL